MAERNKRSTTNWVGDVIFITILHEIILMMKIYIILLFAGLSACSAMDKMKVLKAKNLTINDPDTINRGLQVYKNNCTRCHGDSGAANGVDTKDLKKTPANLQEIAQKKSANSIASNVIFGKGDEMPAFNNKLSRTQIWDVSNYIKATFSR